MLGSCCQRPTVATVSVAPATAMQMFTNLQYVLAVVMVTDRTSRFDIDKQGSKVELIAYVQMGMRSFVPVPRAAFSMASASSAAARAGSFLQPAKSADNQKSVARQLPAQMLLVLSRVIPAAGGTPPAGTVHSNMCGRSQDSTDADWLHSAS